ncbi:ABC transporter permease [Clostridium sp. CM028]|uniref:ABC transporter permease n=1 Tax=Clostridium TaxID=1485 RepID=UPI0013EE8DF4|nr:MULTISPECIES: ABC transporter permease [Clostridium]MBW9145895.1 ABC transporter permease [Clostridium sp. CM027]MBW9149584.1 ABC transporter permease [Clostridium sp. CM028]MBZ9608787.1 ABC transporter permease [Clostridium estertheticum]UVE40874.1 ABC transporter permease [Clostridium sp. CM027]WLC61542.1 ABC transporter permease [Clostridium sp. CM028]
MIEYLYKYHDNMLTLLLQHLQIVSLSISISLVIAIPLSLLILRSKVLSVVVLSSLGVIYSVPSLALFALLIPLLGLGKGTAIFVLVIYNQYILVRNIFAAFKSIDSSIIEAGKGMGFNPFQLFLKVQMPLALPIIIGGIRIATVTTISIATIASVINAGGLGVILFDGLRMNYLPKILWGTIMSAGLAIVANEILLYLEKLASFKASGKCEV